MIPFVIIRKIFLSIAPLVLFYLFKKMVKNKKPKKGSQLSDFNPSTPLRASKSQIVEGEIVNESGRNH
jgi:hypothetical protein